MVWVFALGRVKGILHPLNSILKEIFAGSRRFWQNTAVFARTLCGFTRGRDFTWVKLVASSAVCCRALSFFDLGIRDAWRGRAGWERSRAHGSGVVLSNRAARLSLPLGTPLHQRRTKSTRKRNTPENAGNRLFPESAFLGVLRLVARSARIDSHDSRESGDSRESEIRVIRTNRPEAL